MKEHCPWTLEEEKNLKLHFGWEACDIDNSVHSQPPSCTSEHKDNLSTHRWSWSEGLIPFRWWTTRPLGNSSENVRFYYMLAALAWRSRKEQEKVRLMGNRDELSEAGWERAVPGLATLKRHASYYGKHSHLLNPECVCGCFIFFSILFFTF